MRKYGNRKVTTSDGQVFDSQKEANRWTSLKLMEMAGVIKELERQVEFELIPTQREPDIVGKRGGIRRGRVIEKPVKYIADFRYVDAKTGEVIVEDVKGMRTKDYILKRKMMLYFLGIKIKEV